VVPTEHLVRTLITVAWHIHPIVQIWKGDIHMLITWPQTSNGMVLQLGSGYVPHCRRCSSMYWWKYL